MHIKKIPENPSLYKTKKNFFLLISILYTDSPNVICQITYWEKTFHYIWTQVIGFYQTVNMSKQLVETQRPLNEITVNSGYLTAYQCRHPIAVNTNNNAKWQRQEYNVFGGAR